MKKILFLTHILLISILILVISTIPLNFNHIQNNKQKSSNTIEITKMEIKIPYLTQNNDWEVNGTVISNAPHDQEESGIVCDSDGNAIITWEDNRDFSTKSDIYAQKIASNGTTMWTPNGTIICNALGAQIWYGYPIICSDGDGGAIIAWLDYRSGSGYWDIYAQKIASNGTTMWKENGTVICNSVQFSKYTVPIICATENGGAIIAWYENRTNPYYDIYAQKIASNGTTMWTDNGTIICNAPHKQWSIEICSVGDDEVIIIWNDNRSGYWDIYAQKILSDGTTIWKDNGTVVCNAPYEQGVAGICSDGDGGAIFVSIDNRSRLFYELYAQRIDSTGFCKWTPNGTVICSSTNIRSPEIPPNPSICSAGIGEAIIMWNDNRSGNMNIYAQKILSDGTTMWENNGTVICDAPYDQFKVRICSDGDGGAIAVWLDNRILGNGHFKIYAQRITSGGIKTGIHNGDIVCNADLGQFYPSICCCGIGNAIITWTDSRTASGTDIYALRVTFPSASTIIVGDDEDDDDDDKDGEAIPGYNIFILIGTVCIIFVILVKMREKLISYE